MNERAMSTKANGNEPRQGWLFYKDNHENQNSIRISFADWGDPPPIGAPPSQEGTSHPLFVAFRVAPGVDETTIARPRITLDLNDRFQKPVGFSRERES